MAKIMKITNPDTKETYTLEFTRKTVSQMEKQGFVAEDVTKKPASMLPVLFAGAFLAHHRFVKQDVIDSIYARLGNKEELIGKLVEMYSEPIMTLLSDPDDEGNLTWTMEE